MKALGLGIALTALVTGVLVLSWGRDALLPGLIFGLIATAIQAISVALVRPVFHGETSRLLKRWGLRNAAPGPGRGAGGGRSHPGSDSLPAAADRLGFLGVLVPLLFLEVRLVR